MGVHGRFAGLHFFSGLLEATAGFLLLFRRTTLLGALFATVVTLNVVLLNFCYDVPVKIYSTELLFLALWLAWPDARRLAGVLVLNQPVPAAPVEPPFARRWLRIGAIVLKIVIIGYLVYGATFVRGLTGRNFSAAKSELYGIWEVDSFTRDGRELPPLLTDKFRWRQIVMDSPRVISIYRMPAGPATRYLSKYDSAKKQIALESVLPAEPQKFELTWTRPAPDRLVFTSNVEGHQLSVKLRRIDEVRFLLINRGFHWINEVPFNR